MSVKMRLTRLGDKKSPFYRIVVIDSRKARDGAYIDLIGTYDPLKSPAVVKIDTEKAQKWIAQGVQPSDTVREILIKEGVIKTKKVNVAKQSAPTQEDKQEEEATQQEAQVQE